jgi:tRNA (guanine-N7-)-methyltransferase
MRQRAVKSKARIIEEGRDWLIEDPQSLKGRFKSLFPADGPLCLEIGSGKGRFICGMAERFPKTNFLACEGGQNIYIRILEKARESNIQNLRLIGQYIIKASDIFSEGELDGIYINFCDPWPKKRHAHRRLTHRLLLEEYKRVVKPQGFIAFKTDNDSLFEFSLEEFYAAGLVPARLTRDLHSSPWASENVMTEYEEKFSSLGKTINYALILLP